MSLLQGSLERSIQRGGMPLHPSFVSFDAPPEGEYSTVYIDNPEEKYFASLNAGDYSLYVGGGTINHKFEQELRDAGQQRTYTRYQLLHEALKARAQATPGELCWLSQADLFPNPANTAPADSNDDAPQRKFCFYCKEQDKEVWEIPWQADWYADWPFWNMSGKAHCSECWKWYADWAFSDISAFCGLTTPGVCELLPVGLVSLTVFPPRKRPRGNDRNVSMVYVVGPNCGGRKEPGHSLSHARFLEVVQAVGSAITSTVTSYNIAVGSGTAVSLSSDAGLPVIEKLRICLLCGGLYKHPEASKDEVAAALIRGLETGHVANSPLLDFAYDDNVFQRAWDTRVDDSPTSASV